MSSITSDQFLYRDQHIFVVNKPFGIHTVSQNPEDDSLANRLLNSCPELQSINLTRGEAGLVQRLDRHSSGCVLGAISDIAWQSLKALIKAGEIQKSYIVLAENKPTASSINAKIGSPYRRAAKVRVYTDNKNPKRALPAKTEIEVIETQANGCTWLRCRTNTGRRHQIRAHLAALGSPLVGDKTYSAKLSSSDVLKMHSDHKLPEFVLHAESLNFTHPISHEQLQIKAPFNFYGQKQPNLL